MEKCESGTWYGRGKQKRKGHVQALNGLPLTLHQWIAIGIGEVEDMFGVIGSRVLRASPGVGVLKPGYRVFVGVLAEEANAS